MCLKTILRIDITLTLNGLTDLDITFEVKSALL